MYFTLLCCRKFSLSVFPIIKYKKLLEIDYIVSCYQLDSGIVLKMKDIVKCT
jgi:hypothetical protein